LANVCENGANHPSEFVWSTTSLVHRVMIYCDSLLTGRSGMKRLIEFPLQNGGRLVAEVDESEVPGRVVRVAAKPGEVAEKAQETLEDALEKIKPAAQLIIDKLHTLHDVPDEISVEFGIKLNAAAGAIIASAGVEANYKVTLKWTKSSIRLKTYTRQSTNWFRKRANAIR
jgi:hypothetical protein